MPFGYQEDAEYIGIEELQVTYIQEPDCTESRDDDYQKLTISVRDGGGGFFYHIKTDGWSFDSSEGINTILKDFESRLKPAEYE